MRFAYNLTFTMPEPSAVAVPVSCLQAFSPGAAAACQEPLRNPNNISED